MIWAAIVSRVSRTAVFGALLFSSAAGAGTCKVQNASAPGLWKFIRAMDADTGEVVRRKAVNGGDSVELTVSGSRVQIEYKLAGAARYRSQPISVCRADNTLRI